MNTPPSWLTLPWPRGVDTAPQQTTQSHNSTQADDDTFPQQPRFVHSSAARVCRPTHVRPTEPALLQIKARLTERTFNRAQFTRVAILDICMRAPCQACCTAPVTPSDGGRCARDHFTVQFHIQETLKRLTLPTLIIPSHAVQILM